MEQHLEIADELKRMLGIEAAIYMVDTYLTIGAVCGYPVVEASSPKDKLYTYILVCPNEKPELIVQIGCNDGWGKPGHIAKGMVTIPLNDPNAMGKAVAIIENEFDILRKKENKLRSRLNNLSKDELILLAIRLNPKGGKIYKELKAMGL